MPHIVIEYSENMRDVALNVLRDVHHTVTESGLFDPQAVKGRAIAFDDYMLPVGGRNFMHVTICILSGRSDDEKRALSQAVFDTVKRIAVTVDRLSVDIRDMKKATYCK